MSYRYLILGADGQLGSELRSLMAQAQVHDAPVTYAYADYEECDVTDADMVAQYFSEHERFDAVFNAAAYTAVDDAEGRPDKAMMVNAVGAAHVAAACREKGSRLIHFSTDFVFGDGHNFPIDELAEPEPLSVYGSTKLVGEQLAMQNHSATAVLRTSGLYSRWGSNFLRSIASHARDKERIEVVDDQFISPTPTTTLARAALELANGPLFMGGVYHASSHGECTWFEFAQAIVEGLDINAEVVATTSEKWGAPAQRPEYCVLDNRRLRLMGLDTFGDWEEELSAFLGKHGDLI